MKLHYAFLLGIGITALLTAFLFLPISFQIQEPIPVAAAKAATISLVDRIAVEHSTKETTPAREEVLKDERSVPPIPQPKNLPILEQTESLIQTQEPMVRQVEKQAAAEQAEENTPMLIDGYYPVESVTLAPVFDRALLAARIVYPPLAKRQRKEGLVIVRLFIAESGLVERIVVEEDPGYGLAEAAIAAFTSFKTSPALYKDTPVAVTLRYPIRFTLQ